MPAGTVSVTQMGPGSSAPAATPAVATYVTVLPAATDEPGVYAT